MSELLSLALSLGTSRVGLNVGPLENALRRESSPDENEQEKAAAMVAGLILELREAVARFISPPCEVGTPIEPAPNGAILVH